MAVTDSTVKRTHASKWSSFHELERPGCDNDWRRSSAASHTICFSATDDLQRASARGCGGGCDVLEAGASAMAGMGSTDVKDLTSFFDELVEPRKVSLNQSERLPPLLLPSIADRAGLRQRQAGVLCTKMLANKRHALAWCQHNGCSHRGGEAFADGLHRVSCRQCGSGLRRGD